MATLVYVTMSLTLTLCSAQDTVKVTTSLGTVVGLRTVNSNVEYYSFRGIPYANVTERFKAPTPMTTWQSTVLAYDDGPICPQPSIPVPYVLGEQQENCLYLNVYTPLLPEQGGLVHPKLPVMVLIHGGSFYMGTGGYPMFGPEFFMAEKNVIVVGFNYRLGFFGFLSTGTEDAQGNAGMKDQVEALKWVKQEITHFGGDPSRVTIFGVSAGAASVVLHMLSPMSRGLFRGAIAHSGTAAAEWANIKATVACRRATRVAELLFCNTENTTTIVNCLKKMSISAIIEATNDLAKEEDLLLVTSPVTETGKFDEDVFLPDSASNVLDNLEFSSSVPLIIGTTKDEGMLMLTVAANDSFAKMDKNLQAFLSSSVRTQATHEQLDSLTQKIRQYYFNGGPVTQATKKGFVDLYTDSMFMYPTVQTVRKLVTKKNDVYLYHFVYNKEKYINFWENFFPKVDYQGITHGADLFFISYFPQAGQDLTDTESADYRMTKRMVKLWTEFAKTGSPVSTVDETIKDIKWPKVVKTTELTYLEMNSTFSVGKNYYEEQVALWDQLTLHSDILNKDEL